MKTRDELDELVAALAAEYGARSNSEPLADLGISMGELQHSILAQASPADAAHVRSRLQRVLRDAGLITGDDEACSE